MDIKRGDGKWDVSENFIWIYLTVDSNKRNNKRKHFFRSIRVCACYIKYTLKIQLRNAKIGCVSFTIYMYTYVGSRIYVLFLCRIFLSYIIRCRSNRSNDSRPEFPIIRRKHFCCLSGKHITPQTMFILMCKREWVFS